jgi:hypothetical protein
MKENISTCDKAIAILQATSDGDKLAPLDLKLVESAVNGFLSEEGMKVFNQLHETIVAGKYKYTMNSRGLIQKMQRKVPRS